MKAGSTTLILAWGNPGRLDDGLGPALAQFVSGWNLENVFIDSDYQLQVEDAEQAARCARVLFVDADRTGAEPFYARRIHAGNSKISFSSHSVTPETVLALARDLFHAEPEAWLIGIRGYEFDEFGERLSSGARTNLAEAVSFVRGALQSNRFREFEPRAPEVSHV